jgi:Lar family restriction alleviation protein
MNKVKLLPCPFCGGEAKIHEDLDIDILYQVMCPRCFCKTKFFATTKSAVITWNTRKPMERIVDRLEEMFKHHNATKTVKRLVLEIVKEGVHNAW